MPNLGTEPITSPLNQFQMVFTVEGNKNELLCTLAAMVLKDGAADITEANLNSVISAAGAEVEASFPKAFGKATDPSFINACASFTTSAVGFKAPLLLQ